MRKGQHMSDESKKKQSQSMMGKNKGKTLSQSHRDAIGKAHKGRKRQHVYKSRKGEKRSPEARANMSKAAQKPKTEIWKKSASLSRKKYWASLSHEEKLEKMEEFIAASHLRFTTQPRDTKPELAMMNLLNEKHVEYVRQFRIGKYYIDFYVPQSKTVIEVNGCYWHGCEQCGYNEPWHLLKREYDIERTQWLQEQGYTVKIVWEHQLV